MGVARVSGRDRGSLRPRAHHRGRANFHSPHSRLRNVLPTPPRRLGVVIGQLSVGGAEGQLCQLARRLDRARFEPSVYALLDTPSSARADLETAGVPVSIIGGAGVGRVRSLARALERDRIDLIHSWLFIANTY